MPKSVTKASGSNRSGYQKGYSLGNRGGATPKAAGATASVKDATGGGSAAIPKGGKAKGAIDSKNGMNISFGDLLPVADFGEKPTKRAKPLKQLAPKTYAKEEGDSGSGFNLGKRR